MHELVKNKVYYKIFDKSFKQSSHIYNKKNQASDPLHTQNVEGHTHAQNVQANRSAVINFYQAQNICILHQVHGNNVVDVDNIPLSPNLDITDDIEADGAVTTKANLILTIQSTDCAPVLLSSKDGKVIGVVHCGWRSAKADIVNNVVQLMKDKGSEDIVAIIGPTIHQSSYEVDRGFYDDFVKQQANYAKFFVNASRQEHSMFDLPAFVELKLQQAGVEDIKYVGGDTYSNPDKYISYRRAVHAGKTCTNRMLSTVMIK